MTLSLNAHLASFQKLIDQVCAAYPSVDRHLDRDDLGKAVAELRGARVKLVAKAEAQAALAEVLIALALQAQAGSLQAQADAAQLERAAGLVDLLSSYNGHRAKF